MKTTQKIILQCRENRKIQQVVYAQGFPSIQDALSIFWLPSWVEYCLSSSIFVADVRNGWKICILEIRCIKSMANKVRKSENGLRMTAQPKYFSKAIVEKKIRSG